MNSDTWLRRKANASPYGPEELGRFRTMLVEQRRHAVLDFEGMSESARRTAAEAFGELSSLPLHPGDLASDAFEQTLSLDLAARAQAEIGEVDDALERIDRRCYGVCEDCGARIPQERLLAIPVARFCVPCKSDREAEPPTD